MLRVVWLVPLVPILMAAINLLFGRRTGKAAGWLASGAVAVSFVVAVGAWLQLISKPAGSRVFVEHLFDWIHVGSLNVGANLRVDALSATMILVVTGVGLLIHVYAIGYMHGDARFTRFFAYMNLFVFFMLTLVLADNYVLMYVGWEGVGLCSYLLIGFWFEKPSAANAAKKAFITTRIGDTGMLIGLALIFFHFHTFDFGKVLNPAVAGTVLANPRVATAIALLLFMGAVGKSAQIPLHVWLPDAMEGPTPVSALIHAATMVTAGVYLVVRSHLLFELSSGGVALKVVWIVGLATAIYAATAAIGQDDIKKGLAYSTISQLGFMFFAAGMGAYGLALFLLVVHAFYKALMFLGAGSVMHGLDGEVDMKTMGGLRKSMPVTATVFTIGAAALAGVPPLAGFFAKDHIVAFADQSGRTLVWLIALAGAGLSALYISRIVFLTFFGEHRSEKHPHESPQVMTSPMVVLAVGAALGGALGISATSGVVVRFLSPVVGAAPEPGLGMPEALLTVLSLVVALGAIGVAWFVWGSGRVDWAALRVRFAALHDALFHAWYIDDVVSGVAVPAAEAGSAFLAYKVDKGFVDGIVNLVGKVVTLAASGGRRIQTGLVRTYALAILLGVTGVLLYLMVRT